jgi:hypothetical protein
MTGTTTQSGRMERILTAVRHLLEEAADATVTCPRCRCRGGVVPIMDHAFWYHGLSFSEAAAWLETNDADLFSLAVHYLTLKDRAARTALSSPA